MDDDQEKRRGYDRRHRDGEKRQGVVLEMIQTIDDKHEEAHGRLRQDYRSMERRIVALETAKVATELHLTRIDATPPDITKMQFSTRTVIAIVGACVGLAAGQWALNAKLESNLTEKIENKMEKSSKVQDERYNSQKASTDELRKRFELLQFEFGSLKDTVLRQQQQRR